jgi:hypothetical protein
MSSTKLLGITPKSRLGCQTVLTVPPTSSGDLDWNKIYAMNSITELNRWPPFPGHLSQA